MCGQSAVLSFAEWCPLQDLLILKRAWLRAMQARFFINVPRTHLYAQPVALQVAEELAAWQRLSGATCAVCTYTAKQHQQPGSTTPWEQALAGIQQLHWLDAGANSPGAVYPTNPALLAELGRRCPAHRLLLHLHGTPRQWSDPRRPWLGREKHGMVAACAAAGVTCCATTYFEGRQPSMDMHFGILEAFSPR
jgi:hypothetical protein